MLVSAVIFDLYGTLIDFLPVEDYRQANFLVADALGIEREAFLKEWNNSHQKRNEGAYGSLDGDIRYVASLLGRTPDERQIEEATRLRLDIVRKNLEPKDGAIETLAKIKEVGLLTGLVSDCFSEVAMLFCDTKIAEYIDAAAFSAVEKTVKPDPRIYRKVVRELGVKPEECIYVGDGGSNELHGALEVGMMPILVRTNYGMEYEAFRQDGLEWNGPETGDITGLLDILGLR